MVENVAVKTSTKKAVSVSVPSYDVAVKLAGAKKVAVSVPSYEVAAKIKNKISVAIEAHQIVGGATLFTDLSDTFLSYAGKAGKVIRVKEDETGLEAKSYLIPDLDYRCFIFT